MESELRTKYPEAYAEVMRSPISMLWDNMGLDRKEEILKGIAENLEAKK